MKWYSGEIAEAVSFSKTKGAVFVVYIEGTDEKSQKISDLINNGELGKKLEQDHFVAIKVGAGSTAHRQFSEIYKEPSVPSIYFIGQNGVPLDIITGNSNLDTVLAKVDVVLNRAGINVPPVQSISASVLSDNFIKHEQSAGEPPVEISNAAPKVSEENPPDEPVQPEVPAESTREDTEAIPEPKDITKEEEKKEANVEKDTEETNEGKDTKGDTETKVELSAEEKVQRAKELIELKRQEKQKEEEESERLKELERRKMGQNVQQLKKWQEDQDLKQLKEERDREKRENQIARERVLAQIAQDRAERMSKNQASPPKVPEAPKAASPPKFDSNTTRLQFKLPDGSSVTQEFQITDTLEYVVSFIRSGLHITLSSFTLATTFPKREFTTNDFQTSLLDLQLVPNAVILVLPTNNNGAVSTNSEQGFISIMLWGIFTPIFSLLGYLKRFIFGSGASTSGNNRPPPNEPVESSAGSSSSGAVKRKTVDGDSTTVVKRQGNIHRLSDRKDKDDDNNTWNGNSTQQM